MAVAMIIDNNNNNNNFTIDPYSSPAASAPASTTTMPVILPRHHHHELKVSTSTSGGISTKKRPLNEEKQDKEEAQSCTAAAAAAVAEPLAKKQRTTTTNTNKSKSKSKRVRFGKEYIHSVSRIEDIDAPSVWYSSQEILHSRYCDSYYVRFYTRFGGASPSAASGDDYRHDLFQVLGAACGKLKPEARPLIALSSSECRGLEREMTPCFRQRKKQVVANVLQSQLALKEYIISTTENNNKHDDITTTTTADNNDQKQQQRRGAEILASHYHKLALPATRFARLLAQGDAMIVARDQRQEQQRQI